MRENSGFTETEVGMFRCHVQDLWPDTSANDGSRYWLIGFTDSENRFEFTVEVDARDGRVRYWGPSDLADVFRESNARASLLAEAEEALAKWEAEKGHWAFWSAEDKALFYQENPGWVKRDFPDPDDMGETEAVAIAQQALADTLLADDAYLNRYGLDVGYMKNWHWDMNEDPTRCWIIAFREKEPNPEGGMNALIHQVTINTATKESVVFLFYDKTEQPVSSLNYLDTMYYNPDGGLFFHHDPNCSTVSDAYKPLKDFSRGDPIHNEALQRLLPCHDCVLHEQSS